MLYYKKNNTLQEERFIAVSEDLKHDHHAVSTFKKLAVQPLKDNGVLVTVIS